MQIKDVIKRLDRASRFFEKYRALSGFTSSNWCALWPSLELWSRSSDCWWRCWINRRCKRACF